MGISELTKERKIMSKFEIKISGVNVNNERRIIKIMGEAGWAGYGAFEIDTVYHTGLFDLAEHSDKEKADILEMIVRLSSEFKTEVIPA